MESHFPVAHFSSLLEMTFRSKSVDEYKDLSTRLMQAIRKRAVEEAFMYKIDKNTVTSHIQTLRATLDSLSNSVSSPDADDAERLEFHEDVDDCANFLARFLNSTATEGRKPIMITDWDGTMKDYCSQYATNLQPIYSAAAIGRFAEYTRLTAVLTAGPLRGPGILYLTALPIDGPVVFSGSCGREVQLRNQRVVHDDGISNGRMRALEQVNEQVRSLLTLDEYSQFGLVGSGVQRKVDRLTLGVQTDCKHVHPDLSSRYQEEVRARMKRIDPNNQMLYFDPSTELEVEIVVHNDGSVWNKANGVERLMQTVGDTLQPPGRVLICGDTASDLPMVQHAVNINPQGTMAIFFGANEQLQRRVKGLFSDPAANCWFVPSPAVLLAAMYFVVSYKNRTS
ncbi:putative trehalose-6-phosphate synthase 2 [Aphelenchoides fujianensis]|nr:putative trehalose-6-phosphate synthase 2 [Aphelenchoides fujianensis]